MSKTHEPTSADLQRHQDMVKLVFDWMMRTRATQQKLVRCVQEFWRSRGEPEYTCDHTYVSRMLNPGDPYIPTPHRKSAMKILQATMVICSPSNDANLIETADDEDSRWLSDDEQAFKIHRARLRQLRQSGAAPLYQALQRLGEFVATACWMDDAKSSNELNETFRQRACENVLLTNAAILSTGSAPGGYVAPLSDRLSNEGMDDDQAGGIAMQQIARIDRLLEAPAQCSVNMTAYAGSSLYYLGQSERGIRLLLEAVAGCTDIERRHDPHWETLLELLDQLLGAGNPNAVRWSRQALDVAKQARTDAKRPGRWQLLGRAWTFLNIPRVASHWRELAPDLVTALRELAEKAEKAEAAQAPIIAPVAPVLATISAASAAPANVEAKVQPRGRVKARAVATAMGLALALLAPLAWMNASTTTPSHARASFRSGDHLATLIATSIRGREANGGGGGGGGNGGGSGSENPSGAAA